MARARGRGFHTQTLGGAYHRRERPARVKSNSAPRWRVFIDREPLVNGPKLDLPFVDVQASSDEAAAWQAADNFAVPLEYIVQVERLR
jgi:hypothetical protein